MDRANNKHAISVTLFHTTCLTCCFLALPPHAISGCDKKQRERWVIGSIFLLHDLFCTQFPINNVWIALLSPQEPVLIYTACCKAFFFHHFLTFSYPREVCWTCLLFFFWTQPASHMYRFTCSHQGADRLTQSCFSSIWPLCSFTGAAGGGCSWFKDTSAVDGGREDWNLLSLPRFSQMCCAFKLETSFFTSLLLIPFILSLPFSSSSFVLVFGCVCIHFITIDSDLLPNNLSFSDSLCTERWNPPARVFFFLLAAHP